MKVQLSNLNNTNFQASLKIYRSGKPDSSFTEKSVKYIEKTFAEKTQGIDGHIDVLLFDRYNSALAIPDKIIYTDKKYTDCVNTFFNKNSDENMIIDNLVTIFHKFKEIKSFKDKVVTMFK